MLTTMVSQSLTNVTNFPVHVLGFALIETCLCEFAKAHVCVHVFVCVTGASHLQ